MDIYQYKMRDYELEEKNKTRNCFKVIVQFGLFILYTGIIMVGFRLAEFILSLIYFSFLDIKIFYILILIAIIPGCILFIILFFKSCNHEDKYFFKRFKILIIVIYIYDSICYFFYFFERIKNLSLLKFILRIYLSQLST